MWLTRTTVFVTENGDRPEVNNLAIILTDGVPNREVETYYDEVRNFRASFP